MSVPVLAYYSIRSKQEYIYRTNKIKEIYGASELIKDAFLFFTRDKKLVPESTEFILKNAISDFSGVSGNDGYILYEGGGNLCILFRSKEICLGYNRRFSKHLLETSYSLTPLCAFVEVDLEKDNYIDDYARLMTAAEKVKKSDIPLRPCNTLPISLMNHATMQPIATRNIISGQLVELSMEAYHKQMKYSSVMDALENNNSSAPNAIKELDKLCSEDDSLLAVVYIDGNNMGQKIGNLLNGVTNYNECIKELRVNSQNVQVHFVTNGCENINDEEAPIRMIIAGGDEITFICDAHKALTLAESYLNNVSNGIYSSCAGIAVFHSHYPFAFAYSVAEQACEKAKAKAKEYTKEHPNAELSYIDFHFIRSGAETDLEKLRKNYKDKTARPYCVKAYEDKTDITSEHKAVCNISVLKSAAGCLKSRTNVKELGEAVSVNTAKADVVLSRISSQSKEVQAALDGLADLHEDKYKVLYDMAEFYDLWLAEKSKPENKETTE